MACFPFWLILPYIMSRMRDRNLIRAIIPLIVITFKALFIRRDVAD